VVKQQQFIAEYIFGAVCPSQETVAAIIVPYANQDALIRHLEEIACPMYQLDATLLS
jgi:hypothetical protein